jgi:hypothetical protein
LPIIGDTNPDGRELGRCKTPRDEFDPPNGM